MDDYRITYKKNPSADHSHIVDDNRIFHFIDYIASGHTDNWIHTYETIQHIQNILKTQFAHYLFLFSKSLRRKEKREQDVAGFTVVDFPTNLEVLKSRGYSQEEETGLRNGLRVLHQVITDILSSEAKPDTKIEKLKCLWVFGKYADNPYGTNLSMAIDLFKQYAWSIAKGERVFNQFQPFGVNGGYVEDEPTTYIHFEEENDDQSVAWALQDYVKTLLKKHGETDAYDIFRRADMRCYME